MPRASGKSPPIPSSEARPSTSDTSKARVNIEAVLEPDDDGDGYGDASQDLCPGLPTATAACSGALFGSNLQGERSVPPAGCGGGGCMRIQKTIGGASTAAPFDGVVVRWRVLDAETGPDIAPASSFPTPRPAAAPSAAIRSCIRARPRA